MEATCFRITVSAMATGRISGRAICMVGRAKDARETSGARSSEAAKVAEAARTTARISLFIVDSVCCLCGSLLQIEYAPRFESIKDEVYSCEE